MYKGASAVADTQSTNVGFVGIPPKISRKLGAVSEDTSQFQEIEPPIAHGLPLFLQDPRDVAPAGAPRKHNTTTAVCRF